MGYFSRLVQWHLDDPPSEREIERNNKVCQFYQGNRNPFVDFYEESWELLDFDTIERESCTGASEDDYYDDHYNDDDGDKGIGSMPGYGCADLEPGDVSFFMVQPAIDSNASNDFDDDDFDEDEEYERDEFGLVPLVHPKPPKPGLDKKPPKPGLDKDEEYKRDSFGLVSLVNLKPGLVLYVAGVDDEAINDGSNGGIKKKHDEGILKILMN
eukprot:jgi/Psemu1/288355/fgenesh1_pg.256_\